MIILHTWPITVGRPTEAKLWLISMTVSEGTTNNPLECGLASMQF